MKAPLMPEFINKMENFIKIQLKEKMGRLFIFLVLLFAPGFSVKAIAIFFISASMLPADIKNRRDEAFYFLPFSRKELYLYNLGFLLLLVLASSIITQALWPTTIAEKGMFSIKSINFTLAMFGVVMLCVSQGLDNIGWPFIIVLLDALLGSIGRASINPYSWISFTNQGNILFAFVFAAIICFAGYWIYLKNGGEL
ncbi:hypothetical protein [Carboxydothermus pertinax]|nr:hypothetical protein [Carboxydothermus pertinax]